jgi:hypothetical protein
LLATDVQLAEEIERVIERGELSIPATEVRTSQLLRMSGGWFDINWECSIRGLRPISARRNLGVARVRELIKDLYSGDRGLSNLTWKIRHTPGENVIDKLDLYVRSEPPANIIRSMFLDSHDNLKAVFASLKYGLFEFPSTKEEEDALVDKLLWKLGFDVPLFPQYQKQFHNRIASFIKVSARSEPYVEGDREAIRSVGVNVFVSLEELLDYSLSFITWVLLCDHVVDTRFRCNLDEARHFMSGKLSGRTVINDEPVVYDAAGRNTLFPLIQGFSTLARVCREIIVGDTTAYRRGPEELPTYHFNSTVDRFPFLHKCLLLDLREQDQDFVLKCLESVTARLQKVDCCNLRNRIDHMRKDFPTRNEIEIVAAEIRDVIRFMEHSGICPTLYRVVTIRQDPFGRSVVTTANYAGDEIAFRLPSLYEVVRLPHVHDPVLVVPSLHVGDSIEPLRFELVESSDYSRIWANFPRRRLRLPEVNDSGGLPPEEARPRSDAVVRPIQSAEQIDVAVVPSISAATGIPERGETAFAGGQSGSGLTSSPSAAPSPTSLSAIPPD